MQLRPAIPPKPSKIICPSCHIQKDPNEITCRNCGARSCPNAHLLSPDSRICRQCGWQDRNWKPSPSSGSAESATHAESTHAPILDHDIELENLCPICKTRKTTPPTEPCPTCGYLESTHYEPAGPPADVRGAEPAQREKFIVHQQLPGSHDIKLDYICPRCSTKIDPRDGRCPNCGYIGSMQYEIPQPKAYGTTELQHGTAPPVQRESISRQESTQPPPVSQERSCPKCGLNVSLDSRICPHCGTYCGPGRSGNRQPYIKGAVDRMRRGSSAGYIQPPTSRQPQDTGAAPRMPRTSPAEQVPYGEPSRMQQAAPIYPFESPAGGSTARSTSIPIREIEAPREKKKDRAKEWGYREEKKGFPLGLLMAVIIVAVGLVGMVSYVVVQEFMNTSPPTTTPPVSTTDTTPPEISGIDFSGLSGSGATVTWITDEKATSQVMICDPEGTCSWTDLDKTLVKEHSVTLSNLQADVEYHITVKSVDNSGNEATSEIEQTFTTGASPTDLDPPLISEVTSSDITESSVIITWKTNENATSQVEYGPTTAYGNKTTVSTTLTTTHSVALSGLNGNTTYHYKVISKDGNDNSARSDVDRTFTTLAPIPVGSEVGNRAPEFTLENLAGENVTLSDLRGKIVMLNFWFYNCNPCRVEMPFIEEVNTTWSGSKELMIVAVNNKDSEGIVQSFIGTEGYTFTVLLDPSGVVNSQYDVNAWPRTFFIDEQGVIQAKHIVRFNSTAEIEAILDDL